jgi:integrase
MKPDRAVDLFIGNGDLKPATRKKYRDVLDPFVAFLADELGADATVEQVEREHCQLYLNRWANAAPATKYLHTDVVKLFFEFCRLDLELIDRSPAEKIRLPKRENPEDLDVTHVDDDEVGRLFAACQELDEFLCIAILAYTGVRRTAAANFRWRDVDFAKGTAKFREKRGKVIVKPLADEFAEMLYQIALEGHVPNAPDDYVIPNRAPGLVGGGMPEADRHVVRFYANKRPERNNKVVYNNVKRVAGRAGVDAHPHALRAAFAVRYLEDPRHPGDLDALQFLLGHARVETTRVYLRRQNKYKAMERVRPLSWGSVFQPSKGMPPAGFEPALQAETAVDPIRLKLEELRAAQSRRVERDRRR